MMAPNYKENNEKMEISQPDYSALYQLLNMPGKL